MPDVTDDKGDTMEPNPEDMADTLTASYRTMRELCTRMEGILEAVWIMQIMFAILCGTATFYFVRKAIANV